MLYGNWLNGPLGYALTWAWVLVGRLSFVISLTPASPSRPHPPTQPSAKLLSTICTAAPLSSRPYLIHPSSAALPSLLLWHSVLPYMDRIDQRHERVQGNAENMTWYPFDKPYHRVESIRRYVPGTDPKVNVLSGKTCSSPSRITQPRSLWTSIALRQSVWVLGSPDTKDLPISVPISSLLHAVLFSLQILPSVLSD
ncbi:hypothetical protein NMY22_g18504 [Coprinellus aureogranulatus]|nr:hypothetical protein NMY22_g18504 [Coprinellus aureogranulatus]